MTGRGSALSPSTVRQVAGRPKAPRGSVWSTAGQAGAPRATVPGTPCGCHRRVAPLGGYPGAVRLTTDPTARKRGTNRGQHGGTVRVRSRGTVRQRPVAGPASRHQGLRGGLTAVGSGSASPHRSDSHSAARTRDRPPAYRLSPPWPRSGRNNPVWASARRAARPAVGRRWGVLGGCVGSGVAPSDARRAATWVSRRADHTGADAPAPIGRPCASASLEALVLLGPDHLGGAVVPMAG